MENLIFCAVSSPSAYLRKISAISKNVLSLSYTAVTYYTAQKMTFFIKDFFIKRDQIRSFPRI